MTGVVQFPARVDALLARLTLEWMPVGQLVPMVVGAPEWREVRPVSRYGTVTRMLEQLQRNGVVELHAEPAGHSVRNFVRLSASPPRATILGAHAAGDVEPWTKKPPASRAPDFEFIKRVVAPITDRALCLLSIITLVGIPISLHDLSQIVLGGAAFGRSRNGLINALDSTADDLRTAGHVDVTRARNARNIMVRIRRHVMRPSRSVVQLRHPHHHVEG